METDCSMHPFIPDLSGVKQLFFHHYCFNAIEVIFLLAWARSLTQGTLVIPCISSVPFPFSFSLVVRKQLTKFPFIADIILLHELFTTEPSCCSTFTN